MAATATLTRTRPVTAITGDTDTLTMSRIPAARRALFGAVVLTMGFMVVEASVGFYTKSLALLADAGHMLADSGALGIALIAQRVAERPRTERSTFGYRRAEVLAAFVNGMLLAGIAVSDLERGG